MIAYNYILLEAEAHSLRAANKALSKCRKAKKKRVRNGGTLTVGNAVDLIESREVDAQLQGDLRRDGSGDSRSRRGPRRCGRCHNIGHNSRIC